MQNYYFTLDMQNYHFAFGGDFLGFISKNY